MNVATTWKGGALEGVWTISAKLDGVRVLVTDGVARSRNNKPLTTVRLPDGDYEVFEQDWQTSISRVRLKVTDTFEYAFSLDPLDTRLHLDLVGNPSPKYIDDALQFALKSGYEGLVLRQDQQWIKVKPLETFDLAVIGVVPGTGKHANRMGALITSMGRVGTGFTDAMREEPWPIGSIIEVAAQSVTPEGRLRFPRFVRRRPDK